MKVVFTYLPIRLTEITKIYLKYSIENLNKQNIIPIIYSDNDYFKNTQLKYDWRKFNIDEKFKINTLWSYPKLKVLSQIDYPFIHLDNDFVVKDLSYLISKIEPNKLNLSHKHKMDLDKSTIFIEIFKKYTDQPLLFNSLNNTCAISTLNYQKINQTFVDVCNLIENDISFFSTRINEIPPITLNQQYLNLYFDDINYLFDKNPDFENLEKYGVCHMIEKKNHNKFITKSNLL
jgi:hypothetical protein